MQTEFVVLGSGFAGSLTALILHRQGREVLVVDRATHPRFAIGESSTPIANMVLRDMALRYDLPELIPITKYGSWKRAYPSIVCGKKRGFSYFQHAPGREYHPLPDHGNELLVAASSDDEHSDTQWLRADVDAFFASLVRARGIELWEDALVGAIRHPDATADPWQIAIRRRDVDASVRCRFVIDATGEASVLARALGITNQVESLRTHSRALFTHVWDLQEWETIAGETGAEIGDYPFRCDDAAQHHLFDGAWMWQLRFDQGLTSLGFTIDPRRHPLDENITPELEWNVWLDRYPTIRRMLANARLADVPGRLVRTRRLQRRLNQAAGDHWAMLPNTAGFIDPLHSTGIGHSLCGVERLTDLLCQHWGRPTLPAQLKQYETSLFAEIRLIDHLVAGCYHVLPYFPAFAAMTMLYFASVVTHERRRTRSGNRGDWFLNAHDPEIAHLVDVAERQAASLALDPSDEHISEFVKGIREAIQPYNAVGLFSPPVTNMYRHTVAPPLP